MVVNAEIPSTIETAPMKELKRPLGEVAVRERMAEPVLERELSVEAVSDFRARILAAPRVDLWKGFDAHYLDQLVLPRREMAARGSLDETGAYIQSIAHLPVLSREGEMELAKRIEAGLYAGVKLDEIEAGGEMNPDAYDLVVIERIGVDAKTMMIEANLKLVVEFAKRVAWKVQSLPLLELIEEGNLGLIHAVDKFDYKKRSNKEVLKQQDDESDELDDKKEEYKFSTYAAWWIKQAMDRGIATRSRAIRVPLHVHEDLTKLSKAKNTLKLEFGREPTTEEIAAKLKVGVEDVLEWEMFVNRQPISLDMPMGENEDLSLGDGIVDRTQAPVDDEVIDDLLSDAITAVLKVEIEVKGVMKPLLTQQEQQALALSLGLGGGAPMLTREVGAKLGLATARAGVVIKNAKKKLREHKDDPDIKAFEVYY